MFAYVIQQPTQAQCHTDESLAIHEPLLFSINKCLRYRRGHVCEVDPGWHSSEHLMHSRTRASCSLLSGASVHLFVSVNVCKTKQRLFLARKLTEEFTPYHAPPVAMASIVLMRSISSGSLPIQNRTTTRLIAIDMLTLALQLSLLSLARGAYVSGSEPTLHSWSAFPEKNQWQIVVASFTTFDIPTMPSSN